MYFSTTLTPLAEFVGESPQVGAIRENIARLVQRFRTASRLPPILIQGATGTGKGLIARAIHGASPRAKGAFVAVSCAAIPETLIEAELFGFERGAFTDARQAKTGLFQAAHEGTIFLDEVGLLPHGLQGKLLAVIEERTVRRLGSTRSEPVDVSILSATSEDLVAAVRSGRFREDLYYRLAAVTLSLAPLRERGRDILLLAEHFLTRACAEYNLPAKALSKDARAALLGYQWPGNVRELLNVMERAVLLSDASLVTAEMLGLPGTPHLQPYEPSPGKEEISLKDAVGNVEREHLLKALRQTEWNIKRAAARLEISRNTLRYRIEKYDLYPERSWTPRRAKRGTPFPPVPLAIPERIVAPPDVQWEPRHLTLLHAALVLPPDASFLLEASRVLKMLADKVTSFGGSLQELSPARIVAAFGLQPVDDAPRRAAHAAIVMQKAVERARRIDGERVAVKVGIHCRQVLVGRVNGVLQIDLDAKLKDWIVLDELVNRAESDTIRVSEDAVPFLERHFDLLPVSAPERSQARVFRLAGYERTKFGLWGKTVKLVGRRRELDLLGTLWAAAGRGHGQVVGIVGEAGIGKSRLLFEFLQSLGRGRIRYLEASCLSSGTAIPYFPALEWLKAYFEIEDYDASATIAEKLTAKMMALEEDLEEAIPALLVLFGALPENHPFLILDPLQRRQRALAAITQLLLRESQVGPLLLVIEDLHWVDSETQAVLDSLVESLPPAQLLLLVSYRPGYQPGWGGKTYYTPLTLDRLSPASAEEFLEILLGNDPSLIPIKEALIERTEGNPFFLEENVRTLVETQVLVGEVGAYRMGTPPSRIEVPITVQAVLAARIDRLPPEERHLLQTASVIGKDVPLPLLRAMINGAEEDLWRGLSHLQAAEFLYETQRSAHPEYTFRHILTHEVVYGSLLPERTTMLHAKVLQAIEQLYGDRLTEQAEILAHHALRGEVWDKAVDYLRETGAKAWARGALLESLERYEQALALLPRLPTSPNNLRRAIDVRLDLHLPLVLLGQVPRLSRLHEEAEGVARQLQDQPRLGCVYWRMGAYSWINARYAEGIEYANQALELATALDDRKLRILATYTLGLNHFPHGEYRAAIEHFTRIVDGPDNDLARQPLGLAFGSPYFQSCGWLGWCFATIGDFEQAKVNTDRAVQAADALDSPQGQSFAYACSAFPLILKGEFAQALPWCERAIQLCETKAVLTWLPAALSAKGWILAWLGRSAEGLPCLERSMTLIESMGIKLYLSWMYFTWAEGFLLAGYVEEAKQTAERALELAVASSERGNEADILRLLGEIAAAGNPSDFEAAHTLYMRAKALAEELGMRPLLARCDLDLGRMYRRTGNFTKAEGHLVTAARQFRELDSQFWLEQVEATLMELRAGLPAA
jgi:DNA-binding NtrC family response regulator